MFAHSSHSTFFCCFLLAGLRPSESSILLWSGVRSVIAGGIPEEEAGEAFGGTRSVVLLALVVEAAGGVYVCFCVCASFACPRETPCGNRWRTAANRGTDALCFFSVLPPSCPFRSFLPPPCSVSPGFKHWIFVLFFKMSPPSPPTTAPPTPLATISKASAAFARWESMRLWAAAL